MMKELKEGIAAVDVAGRYYRRLAKAASRDPRATLAKWYREAIYSNCGVCKVYLNVEDFGSGEKCEKCPVYRCAGESCMNTQQWDDIRTSSNDELAGSLERMASFLDSIASDMEDGNYANWEVGDEQTRDSTQ